VRSHTIGGHQQHSGGLQSWRRGRRGARDHGELECMVGDLDHVQQRGIGATGVAQRGGDLRVALVSLLCGKVGQADGVRRCARTHGVDEDQKGAARYLIAIGKDG
jgi:hypothetical protein